MERLATREIRRCNKRIRRHQQSIDDEHQAIRGWEALRLSEKAGARPPLDAALIEVNAGAVTTSPAAHVRTVSSFQIDRKAGTLSIGRQKIAWRPSSKQFGLVDYLLNSVPKRRTYDDAADTVWGEFSADEHLKNSIRKTLITHIKGKLKKAGKAFAELAAGIGSNTDFLWMLAPDQSLEQI